MTREKWLFFDEFLFAERDKNPTFSQAEIHAYFEHVTQVLIFLVKNEMNDKISFYNEFFYFSKAEFWRS